MDTNEILRFVVSRDCYQFKKSEGACVCVCVCVWRCVCAGGGVGVGGGKSQFHTVLNNGRLHWNMLYKWMFP